MSTKNLGQVAGLWIGNSAPENTSLIWYDNTPAIRAHKVYDFALGSWVLLDQNAISAITYSELKNLARNTGLTQGSWYKITDQSNILALAITTTKVQYVDVNNNFVIDDLASSATYVVTSSNLLIDDIQGVWNAENKYLMFSFSDTAQDDNTAEDYVFGKKKRNNVWSLAKYKLSSLVSSVTGNSITWNKGFFFNFRKNLQDNINVSGGVVGKDVYDTDKAALQQSIDNVAASNQAILNSAKNYTDGKVAASEIYSKALPSTPTVGTAIDIASGDTLSSIITKIQRWINQFKTASGIKVSPSFAPATEKLDINNNDTVDSALRKIQYWFNHIELNLSANWIPLIGNSNIQAGDNFQLAFSKLQGKFNYIYENGLYIENPYSGKSSWVDSNGVGSNSCNSSIYPATMGVINHASVAGLGYRDKNRGYEFSTDDSSLREFVAGVAGMASNGANNPCDTFGGYFDMAKIKGLYLKARRIVPANGETVLITGSDDIITCYNTSGSAFVQLPNNPMCGKVITIIQVNASTITVTAVDKEIVNEGQKKSSLALTGAGYMGIFIFDGQYWHAVQIK